MRHKTDLYALGLVLYEIFAGQRLFESTDSAARRPAAKSWAAAAPPVILTPAAAAA